MKKKQFITGLMIIGMVATLGGHASNVLAEEQNKAVETTENSEQKEKKVTTEETVEKTAEQAVTATTDTTSEQSEAVTGTFGTVPWTWEAETQTVTFGKGEFYKTSSYGNIEGVIERDPLLKRKWIKNIRFTEPVKVDKDASTLFSGLNLQKIEGLDLLDTSETVNMYRMFHNSTVENLDLSKLNTSNVTNMEAMFSNSGMLNGQKNFDLNQLDTSNVTNMKYMFNNFYFTELDLRRFNTSKVKNMSHMFYGAWGPDGAKLDLSGWDTSNVEDMSFIFAKSTVEELNMSNWNTRNADRLDMLNHGTDRLKTIHLGMNTILDGSGLYDISYEPALNRWTLVSSDVEHSYANSADLMANYDGSKQGKYVRGNQEDNIKVTGIELTPANLTLEISEEATLKSKIAPEEAKNKKVNYTTSDAAVATVSDAGIVKAVGKGTATITATTEEGGFQAASTVTVTAPSYLLIDTFYLGMDTYVTGAVEADLAAKKVQLVVNDEVITTSSIASDRSFELDTEGTITKTTDKVEVVALDRRNKELERQLASLEEKEYSLTVNAYTLFEDATVSGQTDYFHTHVALVVNGEEIERKLLSSTRKFSFDAEELIEYDDDEVEVIGYRYDDEITREQVEIQQPVIEMAFNPYKVTEPYVDGKVTGKSVANVRLYVNRRRQQTVKVAEDGSFKLLGIAIQSPTDKVEVAVLNGAGIEIKRFILKITN